MKLFAGAALGALLLAGQAFAASLSIVGGYDDVIPANFDPSPAVAGVSIGDAIKNFDSTNIAGGGLVLSEDAKVTFTFLGEEAVRANSATELAGGQSLAIRDNVAGDSISALMSAGFLDFKFATKIGVAPLRFTSEIINGVEANGVEADDLSIAFLQIDAQNVLAFFGDGFGNNDHDDMILLISTVPLPAGALLLLTALGGVGVASRRRKAAA